MEKVNMSLSVKLYPINLADSVARSLTSVINPLKRPSNGFFKKEAVARIGYLALTILQTVSLIPDLVKGLCATVISYSAKFISNTFQNTLHILNPNAKILNRQIENQKTIQFIEKPLDYLTTKYLNCQGEGFFKAHVVSRGISLALAVACAITRITEVVLGAIAMVFALCSFGKVADLNCFAYENLWKLYDAIHDVYGNLTRAIVPNYKTQRKP
jgi:hypothetical protein